MASQVQMVVLSGTTAVPQAGLRLVQISRGGEAFYWAVFGIMAASALVIAGLTFFRKNSNRQHGYCTLAILCIASTAYLSMAMQGGYEFTSVYNQVRTARAIYYARYVDWFLTTPLLLLDILLLTGAPVGTVLWILFADDLMIVAGLFGAVLASRYKWVWYGVGCVALMVVTWGILVDGPRHALKRSKKAASVYTFLALYLCCFWWVYPVTWGLAEGSNKISSTAEAVWYGCLDLITKPLFGFLIMLLAEPVMARQHRDEEAEWGAPLPSLLAAPISAPLLGAWAGDQRMGTGILPRGRGGGYKEEAAVAAGAGGIAGAAAGHHNRGHNGVEMGNVGNGAGNTVGTGGSGMGGDRTGYLHQGAPDPAGTGMGGGGTGGRTGMLHPVGGTAGMPGSAEAV